MAALAAAIVAASAAALAAFAASTAGAARVHVPCRPSRGTTTIAHSRKARILADARTGNVYACLYRNGRPRYLSTIEHWEYKLVRFSGSYVAFVAFAEAANNDIGVMNMATGRILRFHEDEEVSPVALPPSECPSAVPNCEAVCPQVDSLVLKRDGAVAWIAVDFPPPSREGGVFCGGNVPPVTEVRRHDRRGLAVIATGSGISPGSLRLARSTLSWIDEGRRVTSTLR